jgi:hypothetical protein
MWAWHWNGRPARWPARLTSQLKLSVVNGPPRSDTKTTPTAIALLFRQKLLTFAMMPLLLLAAFIGVPR